MALGDKTQDQAEAQAVQALRQKEEWIEGRLGEVCDEAKAHDLSALACRNEAEKLRKSVYAVKQAIRALEQAA